MARGQVVGRRRQQIGDRRLGHPRQSRRRLIAIDHSAQQLHADLKAPVGDPAAGEVQAMLVVAGGGELIG